MALVHEKLYQSEIFACVPFDDGVGLPPALDWRQTNSLGLRLVQMLVRQLNATVQLNCGNSTEFQITSKPLEAVEKGEQVHG